MTIFYNLLLKGIHSKINYLHSPLSFHFVDHLETRPIIYKNGWLDKTQGRLRIVTFLLKKGDTQNF